MKLVGHAQGDVDVAILAADRLLTPSGLPMAATNEGLIYGQDVCFFGFPYGLVGQVAFGSEGHPLPFVKKATVSLLDHRRLFLDGHNNPGFSGGPVVFKNPVHQGYKVAAVISGYQAAKEPIYEGSQITNLSYQDNTGIIEAYTVSWAVDLIKGNPIGIGVA